LAPGDERKQPVRLVVMLAHFSDLASREGRLLLHLRAMKEHTFQLELPDGTTREAAEREGIAHIKHLPYADYTCHESRASTPGMRTWEYSYLA
jgi:hypothetical protein